MKLLTITISILMLSGCSIAGFHGEVIESSEKCNEGVHTIAYSESSEANTTTLTCK